MNKIKNLLWQTLLQWYKNKSLHEGAALAFYAMLALPPLLLILLSVAGFFLESALIQGQLDKYLNLIFQNQGQNLFSAILSQTPDYATLTLGTIFGLIIMVVATSAFLGHLKQAFDAIWGTTKKPKLHPVKDFLAKKIWLFLILLVILLLFMFTVLADLFLQTTAGFLNNLFDLPWHLWDRLTGWLSFIILISGWLVIFKILPEAKIKWQAAIVGAVFTALLFTLGKYLISLYLQYATVTSYYQTAGSLVALVIWIYYSTLIILLGVQFAKIYDKLYLTKTTNDTN